MEDRAILESFRTGVGEKDAFDSLFRKYYPQMCVYAHRFVDMVETEDIVQECEHRAESLRDASGNQQGRNG